MFSVYRYAHIYLEFFKPCYPVHNSRWSWSFFSRSHSCSLSLFSLVCDFQAGQACCSLIAVIFINHPTRIFKIIMFLGCYLHFFDMCIINMCVFDITYPKWIFGVYQESIKNIPKVYFNILLFSHIKYIALMSNFFVVKTYHKCTFLFMSVQHT